MHTLRGSRFHSPTHFAFCDGQPSGFLVTEDGELVEDTVLAEKAGSARAAAIASSRRLP